MEDILRNVSVETYMGILVVIGLVTWVAYRLRSKPSKKRKGKGGSTTPRGTRISTADQDDEEDEDYIEEEEDDDEEEEELEEEDDEGEEAFPRVYLTDAGFFWQIEGKAETNSIYVTTGGIGSSGKRRARHFDTSEGAEDYYTLRIRQQIARGWKEPEEEEESE